MLKWTGALAAAAVVGGAVVYGATYKAPPPPPPSFKPPLSPDVQTTVDGIVNNLIARHAGETVMYGGCSCNCGGSGCMFRYHFKNNALTTVEPVDTMGNHPQVGMEDRLMTQQEFDWALFNRRGCPIGYGWTDHENSPDRVLYPIVRAPGTPRGGGQWVQTDWTTAINTITTNMTQLKAQYGPFFLLNPYGSTDGGASSVMSIWEAGCLGYGLCSDDVARITGPFSGLTSMAFSRCPGNDAPDALKYAKLQILVGMVHFTTRYGGDAYGAGWYRRLAREKGTPIIQIDPKYTWDAEVASGQWIPVKAGTDAALLMAMAYVILTQNLYNQTFVSTYMRPIDFTPQANYILGKGGAGVGDFDPYYTQYDTIPKTPQWAEQICGIPAATITALATLYATTHPAVLLQHSGVRRKSYGEYTLKMNLWLNVITGNGPYVHGGYCCNWTTVKTGGITLGIGSTAGAAAPAGTAAYSAPTFYRAFHWWKAVTYGVRVLNNGPSIMYPGKTMTWTEWGIIVGYNAAPAFETMFNPKMLWGNASDQVTMGENSNAQIGAMLDPSVVFSFHQHTRITSTGRYTDMILPLTDANFDRTGWGGANYGGFDGSMWLCNGLHPGPGQVKDSTQICLLILNGLGGLTLAQRMFAQYNGDATYLSTLDSIHSAGWVTGGMAALAAAGVKNPPTWAQLTAANQGHGLTFFTQSEFIPSQDTFYGVDATGAKVPMDSQSGLYQHYWDPCTGFNQNGQTTTTSTRGLEHFDYKGRKFAHMPNNWKDFQPIAVYMPCYNGMEDFPAGHLNAYPLMIMTSNTRVSTHYLMRDPGNPRTRDTIRHSLIISATDAKARGIKDNDIVRVWNSQGQVAVPAYVTNRIMPGAVQLRTGMPPNYGPVSASNPTGIRLDICLNDTLAGGAVNQFTGGDDYSPVTPAKVTNCVQVELFQPGEEY